MSIIATAGSAVKGVRRYEVFVKVIKNLNVYQIFDRELSLGELRGELTCRLGVPSQS